MGQLEEAAVERQRDEIVEERRGDEPDQDPAATGDLGDPQERVAAEEQARHDRDQVQRLGAVLVPEPLPHQTVKVIRLTHLVLWTPGRAGTITRAG